MSEVTLYLFSSEAWREARDRGHTSLLHDCQKLTVENQRRLLKTFEKKLVLTLGNQR